MKDRSLLDSQFLAHAKMNHFLQCIQSSSSSFSSPTSSDGFSHHVLKRTLHLALIPLDTIFPEKCAFIIGFSFTLGTKMRSLASSLADGVLADVILILTRTPIPPTNIKKVRGRERSTETTGKKGDVEMAKCLSTKY